MASLAELLPGAEETVPELEALKDSPFDSTLRVEMKEAVGQGIARLPTRFRLPLVLKELADFSLGEVAEVLGLKEATVKTRVHRARLLLRKEIARMFPQRQVPPLDHSRQICLDLLEAKQQSLDRGVRFPYSEEELCDRCRATFATLDLVQGTCRQLVRRDLPQALSQKLLRRLDLAS